MFLHHLKYELLAHLRSKEVIIWMILFPILLGVFYKVAFGSIYSRTSFSTIPVAVVEHTPDQLFHQVADSIAQAETPMMTAVYCADEEAEDLLRKGDIRGIIVIDPAEDGSSAANFAENYLSNTRLSLKVRGSGMEQTILKSFIESYMNQQQMLREMFAENAVGALLHINEIVRVMNSDTAEIRQIPLTQGNTDPFALYMYNLVAMVSIFGTMGALTIAQNNQANLSPLGARRACSGTPKLISVLASLTGCYLAHSFCVVFCITFLKLVLGVDFGSRLPLVYLTGICGGIMGVSLGFMIGSIGRWSFNAKVGVCMAMNMTLCFLSGLMVSGMKAMIVANAPIVNDLNPAAVVCDALYCLNMDADLSRYSVKLLTLGAFTAVFVLLGFLMTRRRKYASI